MSQELAVRKLHIDTRFKTIYSKSSSNFSIQLPSPIFLPKNCIMYVSNITLPVSWTMISNVRNKFYYKVNNNALSTIILPDGNYTVDQLAPLMQTKMNVLHPGLFVITFDVDLNIITIKPSSTTDLQIYTDEELIRDGILIPNSINPILQNYKINNRYIATSPYVSNYIDLFPVRTVYLECNNILTGSDNMLCSGHGNIIAAIPINGRYNQLIFSDRLISMDYNTVSNQTISLLNFRLLNIYGEEINMNGNHFGFTMLFSIL